MRPLLARDATAGADDGPAPKRMNFTEQLMLSTEVYEEQLAYPSHAFMINSVVMIDNKGGLPTRQAVINDVKKTLLEKHDRFRSV